MRRHYADFQKRGIQVVAVGMGSPSEAAHFKRSQGIPFSLLSDTGQRSYRAYGLGLMNMVGEMAANSAGDLFRETLRGNFAGIPVGDVNRLGGTFLVDQEGIARFVHRARSTNDYLRGPQLARLVESFSA